MSQVAALVDRLLSRRVTFAIAGDQVRLTPQPQSAITPDEAQILRDHKDELFALISRRESGHGVVIRSTHPDPPVAGREAAPIDSIASLQADLEQHRAALARIDAQNGTVPQPAITTWARTTYGTESSRSEQPRICHEWAGCYVGGKK